MWGSRMGEWWLDHYFNVQGIGVLIAAVLTGARGGVITGLFGGVFYVLRINHAEGAVAIAASTLDGLAAGLIAQRGAHLFEHWRGLAVGVAVQLPKCALLTVNAFATGTAARYGATWYIVALELLANAAGTSLFVNIARMVLAREESAVALAEARAAKGRLELEALRRRLEPHFLFNALNTLRATIRRDPDHAREMVSDMADLYRYLLHHPNDAPLLSELRHAEHYLAIERTRLGQDRLVVSRDLPAELEQARVPALLLQPLVENAVKHGVGAHAGVGSIRLSAKREGGTLRISVEESHAGALRGAVSDGAGIALETLREMLSKRYGEEASLSLDIGDGGSTARVCLPLELDNQRLTPEPSAPLTRESPSPS
jgi:LytS/YehU family sensor histidine kinase